MRDMQELKKKSDEARQLRIEQGLLATKNPIEKAQDQPGSCRRAITAKCYECVGSGGEPNFRDLIRTCTSSSCPLYILRPYQTKKVA